MANKNEEPSINRLTEEGKLDKGLILRESTVIEKDGKIKSEEAKEFNSKGQVIDVDVKKIEDPDNLEK